MKWEVAIIAPSQLVAEVWCEILEGEGIAAMINPGDSLSFFGTAVSPFPCRVMVPEDELQRARDLLSVFTEKG